MCEYLILFQPFSYIWMNGLNGTGVCINSTLRFTPAVSPAFDIEGIYFFYIISKVHIVQSIQALHFPGSSHTGVPNTLFSFIYLLFIMSNCYPFQFDLFLRFLFTATLFFILFLQSHANTATQHTSSLTPL